MKRDWEVIRRLLLIVEQSGPDGPEVIAVDGQSDESLTYHLHLLIDARFVEGSETRTSSGVRFRISGLTWAGHELLDSTRDLTVWQKGRDAMKKLGGGISIEILKDVLLRAAKDQLGL